MNRRRNLLGISRGIIKDGLILYLDGIQNKKAGHDFKVNTWAKFSEKTQRFREMENV